MLIDLNMLSVASAGTSPLSRARPLHPHEDLRFRELHPMRSKDQYALRKK